MWKKPAAASLLICGLSVAAAAHDVGLTVTFSRRPPGALSFWVGARPVSVAFETGESDLVPATWDSVLIQGESPDPGVAFEFSRQLVSGAWTTWAPAQITSRRSDGRFWARARLPKLADGRLRLRGVDGGIRSGHWVEIYGVEVFDSGAASTEVAGPREEGLPPSVTPAERPLVYDRLAWGAQAPRAPATPHVPNRLTLHHTAGRLTESLQASLDEVRFIQDFHQNGRGWNDIGYHFLVDPLGNIFAGRPENALGAHVKESNDGNIGISLLGNHHPPKHDTVTPAALEAFAALGRFLLRVYAIPADSLRGHRDYNTGTDCPGDLAYTRLGELRGRLGQSAVQVASRRRFFRLPSWATSTLAWDAEIRP